MRYLVGFVFVLALVASPHNVNAQAVEEVTTSEPNAEEPAPSLEPASEEPGLQLELGDAGVEVAPSPRREEYRKTELRRARIGLATSVIAFGGGAAMAGVALAQMQLLCLEPCPEVPAWAIPVAATGFVLTVGGLTGTILSGRRLRHLNKQRRWYTGAPESHPGPLRRNQWDLAQSRLVF
jgi:hypothetical protein